MNLAASSITGKSEKTKKQKRENVARVHLRHGDAEKEHRSKKKRNEPSWEVSVRARGAGRA